MTDSGSFPEGQSKRQLLNQAIISANRVTR